MMLPYPAPFSTFGPVSHELPQLAAAERVQKSFKERCLRRVGLSPFSLLVIEAEIYPDG
jgi:hypothetical protein